MIKKNDLFEAEITAMTAEAAVSAAQMAWPCLCPVPPWATAASCAS